jgi:hypothetical protein
MRPASAESIHVAIAAVSLLLILQVGVCTQVPPVRSMLEPLAFARYATQPAFAKSEALLANAAAQDIL